MNKKMGVKGCGIKFFQSDLHFYISFFNFYFHIRKIAILQENDMALGLLFLGRNNIKPNCLSD